MRWKPGGVSEDVEDRRDEGSDGPPSGRGIRVGVGGAVVLLVLSLVLKTDLFSLLGAGTTPGPASPVSGGGVASRAAPSPAPAGEDERVQFVSFVLDDLQATWGSEFARAGKKYPHAKLVLFRDETRSACGGAEAASGPFYCPADGKVYVDLGFYDELRDRFGAPGEFAEAYVLAHEIGHHVQTLLGIESRVRRLQEEGPSRRNALSVKLELQADCLAGIWAHSTERRQLLERGDVESGLGAAAAVGDDRLERQATGRVHPETWTHGSSAERVAWFRRGLESGDMASCDTFAPSR
ncbi:MAG TPA: neutral zinc metallopeptidase [Anaeromyxobacteraceae bacterium]|nr:neutral zinc metallopeptidase [Anaeromyxobacteraceae bacterium]